MLIWLGSYPRSGNSFLRLLLHRCFGLHTYSLYDDLSDIGRDPALARAVGHRAHGLDPARFRAEASRSEALCIAKTHEMPDDEMPAIYLVRDGRAAIVSYWHYQREIVGNGVSLQDVVRGRVWGLPWGAHVERWALSGRPNTLVVRFEQLISNPGRTMDDVAAFLGRRITEPRPHIEFSELSGLHPAFFRRGSNEANIAELVGNDLALFWLLHGPIMARMGYVDTRQVRSQRARGC